MLITMQKEVTQRSLAKSFKILSLSRNLVKTRQTDLAIRLYSAFRSNVQLISTRMPDGDDRDSLVQEV
jgi:hypothetical protein